MTVQAWPPLLFPDALERLSPDALRGSAFFGPGGAASVYRYTLTRTWDVTLPTMVSLMINPSDADATNPDPTLTRNVGFARDAGFGRVVVVNAWAYRTPYVRELVAAARRGIDIVGPENDGAILVECQQPGVTVVVAWGPPRKVPAVLRPRFGQVLALLQQHEVPLHVLALTEDGHPRHPLMLRASCRPVRWAP